jgi:hypothetical protein
VGVLASARRVPFARRPWTEAVVLEGECPPEPRLTVDVAPHAFAPVRVMGRPPGSSRSLSTGSIEIHRPGRVHLCVSVHDPPTVDAPIAAARHAPTATVGKRGTIGGTRHAASSAARENPSLPDAAGPA